MRPRANAPASDAEPRVRADAVRDAEDAGVGASEVRVVVVQRQVARPVLDPQSRRRRRRALELLVRDGRRRLQ
jgi:hypothetical protein